MKEHHADVMLNSGNFSDSQMALRADPFLHRTF